MCLDNSFPRLSNLKWGVSALPRVWQLEHEKSWLLTLDVTCMVPARARSGFEEAMVLYLWCFCGLSGSVWRLDLAGFSVDRLH